MADISEPYDIVIEKGKIVDGTGSPVYHADVGVRNGRIVRIGDLKDERAGKRINAFGLVVSPGFIDIHTHADERIENLPLARNYLQQGVTTLVGGNCGDSIYPIGEKLTALDQSGLGINFALLIGHATIRKQVMGMADRAATPEELDQMRTLLVKAMEQGAFGISTGLYYAPGSYSNTGEVVELAKVAAQYSGIYATHIRDESDYNIGLVAAVKEAIEIGEMTAIPVQLSHLKALGKPVWGKSGEILKLINAARDRGVDVGFDQYPYIASGTDLTGAVIPRWAQAGGEAEMRERLHDPFSRGRIRAEMLASIEKRGGPEKLFVATYAPNPDFEGKHLGEIGKMKGIAPVDAAIELLLSGRADVISFNMLDEDLIRILKSPFGMIGSDGSLVRYGEGLPHPRYYGTFPRVLGKYVREDSVLSLGDAIRKMTSAPANRLGLPDRGLIRESMIADITVFNPATVKDKATFEKPHQYPEGIDTVIVNGQLAVSGGEWTGISAGKVLYRQRT
jgi:N-acyl-D-aspartate/D-glutamate deacylase